MGIKSSKEVEEEVAINNALNIFIATLMTFQTNYQNRSKFRNKNLDKKQLRTQAKQRIIEYAKYLKWCYEKLSSELRLIILDKQPIIQTIEEIDRGILIRLKKGKLEIEKKINYSPFISMYEIIELPDNLATCSHEDYFGYIQRS
jgi:hypothetical protein